jgi:hypothetical protein
MEVLEDTEIQVSGGRHTKNITACVPEGVWLRLGERRRVEPFLRCAIWKITICQTIGTLACASIGRVSECGYRERKPGGERQDFVYLPAAESLPQHCGTAMRKERQFVDKRRVQRMPNVER